MGCCGKPKSKKSKLKEAAYTFANVFAGSFREGQIKAEKDVISKRLDICHKCPRLKGNRCELCGCFMVIKASLKHAACPAKKW